MTRVRPHHPTLLIVDDDQAVLDIVGRLARREGFEVTARASGREAIAHLAAAHADVVVVDLRMPDIGGLDVVRSVRETDPDCQIILMSGAATIDSAVEAVKLGAIDYWTKPFDFARVKTVLASVKEEAARRRRLLEAEREVARNLEFCGMIGRSAVMQDLFALIRRLAPHVRTALVTGETGTGKELVARALGHLGPRRHKRFVVVNCSAVTESLFESELFGHVRGAFTGASDTKQGLFEVADGGTLFLDEVGELPQAVQGKLLRALESGEIQRVGAVEPRRVDVHVIAATNRDLRREVQEGRFRADLFYRLNVVDIHVPPLRERREDIPYLTAAFVRDCGGRLGKKLVGTTPAAERRLADAPWSGNVRELRNAIERACLLADGEFVTERELNTSLEEPLTARSRVDRPSKGQGTLSSLERERIVEVLERTGGNKMEAARELGLSRRALYRRLERYGIGIHDDPTTH